ncbi:MAG: hypothetical protein ACRDXX_15175 [Stackebrandtia sp.]
MNTVKPARAWWSEDLPGGDRRDWLAAHRRYTDDPAARARVADAIAAMQWHPPKTSLPLTPGSVLVDIARQLNLRLVGAVGISDTRLEYPEPAWMDYVAAHPHPDTLDPETFVDYQMLGIRQLIARGWIASYWLTTPTSAICLACDDIKVDRPDGVTVVCALNRHAECPGTSSPGPAGGRRQPCGCDCGCTRRTADVDGGLR